MAHQMALKSACTPQLKLGTPKLNSMCHYHPTLAMRVRASMSSHPIADAPAALEPASASTSAMPKAIARVDTGQAVEQLQVPLVSPNSSLLTVTLKLPMGLVLEEYKSDGLVRVVEVTPGSAAAAKNVREGDIVRVITAASMQMTYPTMNLMLGGVGRPKLKRVAVQVTGKPFAWVREGILSNQQLGDDITLVLERPGPLSSAQLSRDESGYEDEPAGGPEWDAGSVFDPRLFE